MEARRRGYRQEEAAPPDRPHPLTNLTRSMSQPVSEPASVPASAPALRHIPRRYLALGLIIVAICLLGALVLVRDNSGPTTTSTVETFNAAPSSLVATVTSVPASVYDAVGVTSPTVPVESLGPAGTGGAPIWLATAGGPPLPVVFFYGAEFAPYPAVQRWPLILALSRFGTFTQLGVMQSSATTAFASLSTFTFWNVRYSSKYVILESVERYSALESHGRAVSRPPEARRPAVRRHRQLRGEPHHVRAARCRQPLRPQRCQLHPGRAGGALTEPDRRELHHAGQPADPSRRDVGQRDHGQHLRRRQ